MREKRAKSLFLSQKVFSRERRQARAEERELESRAESLRAISLLGHAPSTKRFFYIAQPSSLSRVLRLFFLQLSPGASTA